MKKKQKMRGTARYVTGLWEKSKFLKSGRINRFGWANVQAFGEDTMFILKKVKRKRNPGDPDWKMYAVKAYAAMTDDELKDVFDK
jgi:hypothetical protein